jgi:hypothetical protein
LHFTLNGPTVKQVLIEVSMSVLLREARLRERYANLYPGLVAGHWLPAAEVADHIASVVRRRWRSSTPQGRVMADEHFEFTGGALDLAGRSHQQQRREDREADPVE